MRSRSLVLVAVASMVVSGCNPSEQQCPDGTQLCASGCVDVASSTANCGACDSPCEDGARCVSGACINGCALPTGFVDAGVIEGCLVCEPVQSTTELSPREDGIPCDTGLCHAGQCETSCFIDGLFVSNGTLNDDNPCERCDTANSNISWSTRADGTECGTEQICQSGVCDSGCFIGGNIYALGTANPLNACQTCDPTSSTTAWTTRGDGASCGTAQRCRGGTCGSGCSIDFATWDEDATNPANVCERCAPATSTTSWTAFSDGTSCGSAQFCSAGTCNTGCFIDGVLRNFNDLNPSNACEVCAPAISATSWTTLANGTGCGNAQVCQSGACGSGCFIDNVTYATGAANPANACQQCAPGISTMSWSARTDGDACGAGQVCNAGTCSAQCFINGALVDAGVVNSANACEACVPAQNTTAWSSLDDGTSCGAGQVCRAGACDTGCFIAQAFVDAGVNNPSNACERCVPADSATSWSVLPDGTVCGSGVCASDTCLDQCFIDGGFIDAGALDPANLCHACVPATSTSEYSPHGVSTLLTPGTSVTAQGWSVTGVGTRSLTDDGGVIVLSTSTVGSVGGQQLLYRNISATGGPFTLRVEWRVDAVSPHNTLDSAAAILGSFTSGAGTTVERQQMVYLDAAKVGWSDDSQSANVGNLDGGFHLYELAVDADAGARFSVDGVQLLSRGNFSTNGVIAIGDQTNDPNVDSTLSLRSVSLVCQ